MGMIVFGVRYSFGVFFKSLSSDFGLTRAETSSIFSASMLLSCIFALVSGWTVDKYGPRTLAVAMGLLSGLSLLLTSQASALWQLFITYSLLIAMGTGGIYVVRISTITRWFHKRRGLAIGISTSGTGLGTVILAPLATYLIEKLGWRDSCIIMAFIAWLFLISMAILLKKDPSDMGQLPDGAKSVKENVRVSDPETEEHFSLLQAFRTRIFWYLWFTWLLFSSCLYMVMTHIVPYATDIGISAMKAATLLSVIGGSSILGRLLIGRVSDTIGRKKTAIACALLTAGAMIWLVGSHELWMLYLFAAVFGFSYGGVDTSVGALIGDTFGVHRIGIIIRTLSASWALGGAIGPTIGGLVYDSSNNYSAAFAIGILLMTIVILLLASIRPKTNERTPHHEPRIK